MNIYVTIEFIKDYLYRSMKQIFSPIILRYLRFLTRIYIKRQDVDIIGLTGSVGKTILTLAIQKVLAVKYKTGMTYKAGHGLNSETGIPLAILGVHVDGYAPSDWLKYLIFATFNFFFKSCKYEKLVVEMGVDKPDDMKFLLSIIKPDVGVFLSISKVHTENFEQLLDKRGINENLLNLVFEEKSKLIKALNKSDWAVLNIDQEMIGKMNDSARAQVITFGLNNEADVKGEIEEITQEEFKGKIIYKEQEASIEIRDYFVNKSMFMTLLAAVAVGVIYKIDVDDSVRVLEELTLPPGRMSKIEGIRDTLIIDSSYNASKLSMFEAFDNLSLFKNRKRIAVLGDMRELGEETKSEHEAIVEKAIKAADEIVLVGPAMRDYFLPEAVKQGFSKSKIHYFLNAWKALDFIRKDLIKGKEVVLVKGSQNTLLLEIIVEGLMKDKSRANEVLCRRGKFWQGKREELRIKN